MPPKCLPVAILTLTAFVTHGCRSTSETTTATTEHDTTEQPQAATPAMSASASTDTPPPPSQSAGIITVTIPGTTTTFDLSVVRNPDGTAFLIQTTEVTWEQYLLFCAFDENPPEGYDFVTRPSKPLEVAPAHRDWGLGKRPAVSVSWNGARKYCAWLSKLTGDTYRLPTEREWERACADSADQPLDDVAWYQYNANRKTQEVAQKKPNKLGIHDMLGNLWEYCSNPYSADEPERAVLRGGSWKDGPDTVTPTARLPFDDDWVLDDPNFPPGVWWVPDGDHLGFRVVREIN